MLINAISDSNISTADYDKVGERIFNLEKLMNFREGFNRLDDVLPERFFKDAHTFGLQKDVLIGRDEFEQIMDEYYVERGWNPQSTKPEKEKITTLGLDFVQL
jgi:aldehyde:ferredoxin oxidoreductase